MVNPGSFKGFRRDFLYAQADLYADAIVDCHVSDTVADIQRRYFKRYPPLLAEDEEPSEEWLALVDDNAPDDEILRPQHGEMAEEEYKQALERYEDMLTTIRNRKAVSL